MARFEKPYGTARAKQRLNYTHAADKVEPLQGRQHSAEDAKSQRDGKTGADYAERVLGMPREYNPYSNVPFRDVPKGRSGA